MKNLTSADEMKEKLERRLQDLINSDGLCNVLSTSL